MKNYDLYRGPTPQQLRTFDKAWKELLHDAYSENCRRNSPPTPPVFVGRMPMRQDLEVEPMSDPHHHNFGHEFRGWENPVFSMHWPQKKWWHPLWRMKQRLLRALGLLPKGDSAPRLI